MDDDIAIVQQHPTVLAVALAALRLEALLSHFVFDFIHDGADLTLVVGRSEHEDLGNGEDIGDINGRDIGGQLFLRGVGRGFCHAAGEIRSRQCVKIPFSRLSIFGMNYLY